MKLKLYDRESRPLSRLVLRWAELCSEKYFFALADLRTISPDELTLFRQIREGLSQRGAEVKIVEGKTYYRISRALASKLFLSQGLQPSRMCLVQEGENRWDVAFLPGIEWQYIPLEEGAGLTLGQLQALAGKGLEERLQRFTPLVAPHYPELSPFYHISSRDAYLFTDYFERGEEEAKQEAREEAMNKMELEVTPAGTTAPPEGETELAEKVEEVAPKVSGRRAAIHRNRTRELTPYSTAHRQPRIVRSYQRPLRDTTQQAAAYVAEHRRTLDRLLPPEYHPTLPEEIASLVYATFGHHILLSDFSHLLQRYFSNISLVEVARLYKASEVASLYARLGVERLAWTDLETDFRSLSASQRVSRFYVSKTPYKKGELHLFPNPPKLFQIGNHSPHQLLLYLDRFHLDILHTVLRTRAKSQTE